MASCGISLNLSSLESKITANIGAMLGIAGLAGLPFGTTGLLAAVSAANGNFLAAIDIMVPGDALDGLWDGLRDEFDGVFSGFDLDVDLPGLGDFGDTISGWGDDLAGFAKSTGLDQLSGFVDINITDLAKSAIGLGASFSSCDFGASGIPNYFKDPATGAVRLLANYAPKLGDTSVAKSNSVFGLTAAVNTVFQLGKGTVQLNLNTALGDVVSSGTSYALDKITGSTSIDSRDISNVRQYLGGQTLPSSLQSMRKAVDGSMYLSSTTTQINDLKSKITGVYNSSENNLSVMSSINFGV